MVFEIDLYAKKIENLTGSNRDFKHKMTPEQVKKTWEKHISAFYQKQF